MCVIHDRQNQCFTITLDGAASSAVLKYTITHDQLVELMSTEVPQSHRGKGVAAHLAKAALDFVVEENMKARISSSLRPFCYSEDTSPALLNI